MEKYYVPATMDNLLTDSFPNIEEDAIQTIMRDAATLCDMAVEEYGENGCYVSNIRDLADTYERAVYQMLKRQFD